MNILSVSFSSFCRTYVCTVHWGSKYCRSYTITWWCTVLQWNIFFQLMPILFSQIFLAERMSCPFVGILPRQELREKVWWSSRAGGNWVKFWRGHRSMSCLATSANDACNPPLSSASKTWNKNFTISPKAGFTGYYHDHDGKTTTMNDHGHCPLAVFPETPKRVTRENPLKDNCSFALLKCFEFVEAECGEQHRVDHPSRSFTARHSRCSLSLVSL